VRGGGGWRFCRAEPGRHYLVYSMSGAPILRIEGQGLQGVWFDPRDPRAEGSAPFPVEPGRVVLAPPDASQDWVLWISDGSTLGSGTTRPTPLLPPVRQQIRPATGSPSHE
jgi:hypothetical protein